jgi:triacylglycerol lipase
MHLLAYNGRDDKLFSGAIAESGPTSGFDLANPTICKYFVHLLAHCKYLTLLAVAEEVYKNVTAAVNCSEAVDKLACLRLVPTEVLNNTFASIVAEDFYQLNVGPLVDGDIIARGGNEQLMDGSFVKVPYILGDNSDEGTDFVIQGINTDDDFIAYYKGFGMDNATLTELLKLYPNDPKNDIPLSSPGIFNDSIGLQFKRSATLTGDIVFKAPRRFAARQWNKFTNIPLYSYRFNAIPNGIPDYYAVTHGQEVAFVFHNIHGEGYPNINPPYFGPNPFANRSQSFLDLATLMSRMWASFIHDKNPNFHHRMFCRNVPV